MSLEEFKTKLKIKCDSENTIATYYNNMKRFFDKHDSVNQKTVDSYYIELKDRGLKAQSLNLFVASLVKYCEIYNIDIDFPEMKSKNIEERSYITEEQLKDIVKNINYISQSNYYIDKFLVQFMFYTGLRKNEIVSLKIEDIKINETKKIDGINRKHHYIIVRDTKGKHDRIIPFDNVLKLIIEKVMVINNGKETLFDISYKQLELLCNRINKGMNLKISPHSFRHGFARHMLKKGVDLYTLKNLMGHSNIKTTEIYLHETSSELTIDICWKLFNKER